MAQYQLIKCLALTMLGAAYKLAVSHQYRRQFCVSTLPQLYSTCSLVV